MRESVCEDGAMTESQPDPVIADVVEHVRDRFGAPGLADLIALAREELAEAEAALKELGTPD